MKIKPIVVSMGEPSGISSEIILELYVNAQRLSGTCCNYTEYKEIGIQNAAYELDKMTGVYKILIP